MKVCKKCGRILNPHEKFCSQCGTPAPKEDASAYSDSNSFTGYTSPLIDSPRSSTLSGYTSPLVEPLYKGYEEKKTAASKMEDVPAAPPEKTNPDTDHWNLPDEKVEYDYVDTVKDGEETDTEFQYVDTDEKKDNLEYDYVDTADEGEKSDIEFHYIDTEGDNVYQSQPNYAADHEKQSDLKKIILNKTNSKGVTAVKQKKGGSSKEQKEFTFSGETEEKLMSLLSYFGILVLIPIFAKKDSPFVRFHANQGLVLLIATIIVEALSGLLNLFYSDIVSAIVGLLHFGIVVLQIMGAVCAIKGEKKELPVVGKIHILK